MKKILLIISFLVLPFFAFAEIENVGIIKGIWFSDAEFFDGDTIRIYTAVQNNSGNDASGNIEFFDNGQSLGIKTFSALNNRIIESWMDTVAISGEHQFSVRITQLIKGDVAVTAQEIFSERLTIIKIDTDGDNIPDDIDTDDDGDGYSDADEIVEGSDPLNKQSIPTPEETETKNESNQNNSDNIITIIKNIFNNNSSDSIEKKDKIDKVDDTPNEDSDIKLDTKIKLLNQSPDLAQKVSEQNSLIQSLVIQISKFQNGGQSIIKREQLRINEEVRVLSDKTTVTKKVIRIKDKKEDKKDIIDDKKDIIDDKEKSSFKNILMFIYATLLNLFGWLFSLWWLVVILLFLGIYLLLRLLFKIFGRDRN